MEGTNTASRSPTPISIIRPRRTLPPASSGSTASPSTNKKKINVMHKNRMPSVFKFAFSTNITKNKAENIRERDEREALRKKQKLENCIINIDDYDIDFGGLGVGGDTV